MAGSFSVSAQKKFQSKPYFYLTQEDRNELTLIHDSIMLTSEQSSNIISLFFQYRTQIDQETMVLHEVENLKNIDPVTKERKLINRKEYIRSLKTERDKGVYQLLNEQQRKLYNRLIKQIKNDTRIFGMPSF